ncbi:TonB-dependent heme/hemoglobin receptor family protein [Stappia sp. 22II-S9-Z10]|nr:TonB-dependent heme/hemoglobin receptor family protein [Stappia sp. 22II-S9-Z10]
MWRTPLIWLLLAGTSLTAASAQDIVLDEVVVASEPEASPAPAPASTPVRVAAPQPTRVAAAPAPAAPTPLVEPDPAQTTPASSVAALNPRLSPAADAALMAPSATTVITRETIQREGGRSIAGVLESTPGVTVTESADDPAVSINIRGMQEFDRVAVTIDGARQNFGRSGHSANSSVYVDQRMIQAVDITRGPVQAVGGSAVGGTVAFETIDADNVLRDDETWGGRLETSVESNGPGGVIHGEAAARIGQAFDVLAAGTFRHASDYRTGDGERVQSATELTSGLLKTRLRLAEEHETVFSAMRVANDFRNGTATVRSTQQTDDTVTLGHHWDSANPFIDLNAKVYYTGTHLDQKNLSGTSEGATRSFDIATYGGSLYNTATFDAAGFSHTTTVGGDGFYDDVTSKDSVGLSDGSTPSGSRGVYGAYVQHAMERGWFEVIGALRYDGYWSDGTVADTGEDIHKSDGHLSPKITVAVTPVEPVTFYASYSEAFRAPSITETLVQGVHPPPAQFDFIPNPFLEPEIAHNIEAGVNLDMNSVFRSGDALRFKGSVFHNVVDNYIVTICSAFPLPGGCTYENLDRARLYGFEVDAIYDMGRAYGQVTATYTEAETMGDDDTDFVGIQPWRVAGTLGMRAFEGKLDVSATVTHTGAVPDAAENGFIGDAYTLVDAAINYTFTDDTSMQIALKNIFNEDYTQYLDLEPSPGFSAFLTVSHRFGGSTRTAPQGDLL